jgi:hypothetical protein
MLVIWDSGEHGDCHRGSLAQLSASANAPSTALPIAGSKNIFIDGGTGSFAHVPYVPPVKTFELSEIQNSLQRTRSENHRGLDSRVGSRLDSACP